MSDRFSEEQIQRYARHIVLSEVGGTGQAKLTQSSALVVGTGGLGSPAALYLAAAGIGTLGIVDYDRVELSNLQRQILHFTPDVGRLKTDSAKDKLTALNPEVEIKPHQIKLTAQNAVDLVRGYDVVIGALDAFEPRYHLNDACVRTGTPLVEAGVLRFEGLLMTVVPGRGPCYKCVFPQVPSGSSVPTCAEVGVIGALPGTLGTLQAMEAIKVLLDIGTPMVGRLLIVDALHLSFKEVKVEADPACTVCGRS